MWDAELRNGRGDERCVWCSVKRVRSMRVSVVYTAHTFYYVFVFFHSVSFPSVVDRRVCLFFPFFLCRRASFCPAFDFLFRALFFVKIISIIPLFIFFLVFRFLFRNFRTVRRFFFLLLLFFLFRGLKITFVIRSACAHHYRHYRFACMYCYIFSIWQNATTQYPNERKSSCWTWRLQFQLNNIKLSSACSPND